MPLDTMKKSTVKWCVALLALACAVAWGWFVSPVLAQTSSVGTASDFKTSEYFDPPHENQVKLLVTGAEAQMQSGGRYLIRNLKLETFRENGQRELTVEAPECLFDSARRVASSAGHLQVEAGDGRFRVEGDGFLCNLQSDKSSLTISNRVRTLIRELPSTKSKS
jgi:hypothetical protein